MPDIDNGGAYAIKGFNYQKSVIVLIAVLHYFREGDFQIYVESEDDIVISRKNKNTYIQAKSNELSLGKITKRGTKNEPSIIEKNLSSGGEEDSYYKLVTPNFKQVAKNLEESSARILTQGADIYSYNKTSSEQINKKFPHLSKTKIKNARIALTAFKANKIDAQNYIMGVMAGKGISVDNNYGRASLLELCNEIDERGEIVAKEKDDFEKKKFTRDSLATIFRHSYKAQCFEEIVTKLGLSIAKKQELKRKSLAIGAVYGSYYAESKKLIEQLELTELDEKDVIEKVMRTVNFNGVPDSSDREAIVIDALCQVLFERGQYDN